MDEARSLRLLLYKISISQRTKLGLSPDQYEDIFRISCGLNNCKNLNKDRHES